MIQRVQTIFLFLVCVAMGVCLFSDSWQKSNANGEQAVLDAFTLQYQAAGKLVSSTPTFYIAILNVLVAGVALYSIFQYRNRLRQIKLGALNSLLMAVLLGCLMYFSTQMGEKLLAPTQQGQYTTGFFAVVIALISNTIANRFIRRDEHLVRSADRMR